MIRLVSEIDIDSLRKNCQMIHYFGLGFIQLKIDKYHRLHFYNDELPAIVSEEDIHNHRYDFRSVVVKGTLTQEIFDIQLGGFTHIMEDESCQKDKPSTTPKVPCFAKSSSMHNYAVGSEYTVTHDVFHRVCSAYCITSIKRTDYKKEYAQVVRPRGAEKVCPFSKQVDEKRLWEIVDSMVR